MKGKHGPHHHAQQMCVGLLYLLVQTQTDPGDNGKHSGQPVPPMIIVFQLK